MPLALVGVIVAVPGPLYAQQLRVAPMSGGWFGYAPLTRTVYWSSAQSSSFGTFNSGSGLLGIAEGWYWPAALTAGFLLSAVRYGRAGRNCGTMTPGLGYLLIALVLTAAVTAVPLQVMRQASLPAWLWLDC